MRLVRIGADVNKGRTYGRISRGTPLQVLIVAIKPSGADRKRRSHRKWFENLIRIFGREYYQGVDTYRDIEHYDETGCQLIKALIEAGADIEARADCPYFWPPRSSFQACLAFPRGGNDIACSWC